MYCKDIPLLLTFANKYFLEHKTPVREVLATILETMFACAIQLYSRSEEGLPVSNDHQEIPRTG